MQLSPRKRKRPDEEGCESEDPSSIALSRFLEKDCHSDDPIATLVQTEVLEWLIANMDCPALIDSFRNGFTPKAVRDYFGATLRDYIPVGVLGMPGGTGAVFKCVCRQDSSVVQAMKIVNVAKCVAQHGSLKRLESEVAAYKQLQADMQHPNIVRLSDFIVNAKTCVLQMNFCKSVDLYEAIFEGGYFDGPDKEQRAQNVTAQIVAGLWFAHTRNPAILHRDIKPANVLLLESGLVKLIDWDLARDASGNKGAKRRAGVRICRSLSANTVLGTPGFRPPEIEKCQLHDETVDSYSLGCTVAVMATGTCPGQVDDARDARRLMLTQWLDHWASKGVDMVAKGHPCRELIDGLAEYDPAHRMSTEQAANHPWLQEAMRCHCTAHRLEAHGMRIEESDGGKIQITMALADAPKADTEEAKFALDVIVQFKAETEALPEVRQENMSLAQDPSLFRSLHSIRIAYPELVYKGLMALQLAELYTKSFTEQSKKNKALQEVETAIALFTQYEGEAVRRNKIEIAAEKVRVVGKKGLHSPTTQPMLRAIELKNEIIAKLILASRENSA